MKDEHLHISQDIIHLGKVPLGKKSDIIADPGEFRGVAGVEHLQLPGRMDVVFSVGDRVAAGEIKRPADLVTSHQRRRLQRQLRFIRQEADIGILFLRDFTMERVFMAQMIAHNQNPRYRRESLWQDLAGFQTQGGYVLHLPEDDAEAIEFILWYQTGLAMNGVRMFAGTDAPVKARRKGTLLRDIKGIGPKTERDLLRRYSTPIGAGLAAMQSPELVQKHFGPGMVKRLRNSFEEKLT